MAKRERDDKVEVEALIRFPYKGRAMFIGDRFTVDRSTAETMIAERIVQEAKGRYLRRDMVAQDS